MLMFRARGHRVVAVAVAGALLLAACGSDDSSSSDTTESGGGGGDGTFAVDTSDCPPEATEPIEGTVKIGTTLPLSGGSAAAAFAPVAAGMENYYEYANRTWRYATARLPPSDRSRPGRAARFSRRPGCTCCLA
jgi:hypothetical protein